MNLENFMALPQIRFCKKFLGILFFGDTVDTYIHEETKNKITTKFEVKGRICDSALILMKIFCLMLLLHLNQLYKILVALDRWRQVQKTLAAADSVALETLRKRESLPVLIDREHEKTLQALQK